MVTLGAQPGLPCAGRPLAGGAGEGRQQGRDGHRRAASSIGRLRRIVRRVESWTLRDLARLLSLIVVICLAGSILGPTIRGDFGYTWGYLSGILGPAALIGLSVVGTAIVVRLWRD